MIKLIILILGLIIYIITAKNRKSGKTEEAIEAAANDLGMKPMEGHDEIVAYLNEAPWEIHRKGDLENGMVGAAPNITLYLFDYNTNDGKQAGWVTSCLMIMEDWKTPTFTLIDEQSSIKSSKLSHRLSPPSQPEYGDQLSLNLEASSDAAFFTDDLLSFLKWRNPTFNQSWDVASFPNGLMLSLGDTHHPPGSYQLILESALEVKDMLLESVKTPE